MTQITVDIQAPTATGNKAASGYLVWSPTRRRYTDTAVVLPAPFTVRLVDGKASFSVDATTAEWVWRVDEVFDHQPQTTIYVTVHGDSGFYADLSRVDPITLEPFAEPSALWWETANNTIQDAALSGDELLFTRYNGEQVNVGNIRGRQGTPGQRGLPGKDGVDGADGADPSNAVTAQHVTEDGPTKTALSATIASEVDPVASSVQDVAVTVKDVQSAKALRSFRNARAAALAGTGRLNIVCLGDSVTEGRDVGDAGRWATKLRNLLRTRWQPAGITGGEGYVPAFYVATGITDRWTFAGGANLQNQYGLGMRANHMASGAGISMTCTFTGTSFALCYSSNSGTGDVTVTIDGGAPVTVDTTDAAITSGPADGGRRWVSPALTAGSHTVALTNTSGATLLIEGIEVFNGDETAGVRVLEGGHSGWAAEDFAADATADSAMKSLAGFNPHLVIVALGYNDISLGYTAEQFRVDSAAITTKIKAQAPGASVLFAGYGPRADQSAEKWGWFLEAMRDVAESDSAAYVDLSARTQGIVMPDGVHPDAAGHTMIAEALDGYLASM